VAYISSVFAWVWTSVYIIKERILDYEIVITGDWRKLHNM